MKLAVYSKFNLRSHPVKLQISNMLKQRGFDVVEVESIDDNMACDRLVVFGGDGTMLYAAVSSNRPILGVNLGNIGFLTQFESDVSVDQIVTALEKNTVFSRNLIEGTINDSKVLALNDITIKSSSARPIILSVYVDDEFVDKYHADGIVVSTPTGSTAYSLSAGGPVLAPDVDAIVVNPICPHSLHSRTLVIGGNSTIQIKVDNNDFTIIADGNNQLKATGIVTIKKSSKTALFVGENKTDFYKKLLEKMNRWGTTC